MVTEDAANIGAGRQYIDARLSYIRHGVPCLLGRSHIARLLRDYVAKSVKGLAVQLCLAQI